MQIIDVSVPVRPGMVTYPGDPPVRLERVSSIADGAAANLSRLDFGVHSGTHVDAPLHFVDRAAGAEALPLDVLVGPCVVVDGLDVTAVPAGVERVLFKTANSRLWERDEFSADFVKLDGAADARRGGRPARRYRLSVDRRRGGAPRPARGRRRRGRGPRPARGRAGRVPPRLRAAQACRLRRRPCARPAPPGLATASQVPVTVTGTWLGLTCPKRPRGRRSRVAAGRRCRARRGRRCA